MGNDNKLENAKLAAHAFIDVMDLDQSRVGLVTFNHRAGVRSSLVGREGEDQVRDATGEPPRYAISNYLALFQPRRQQFLPVVQP